MSTEQANGKTVEEKKDNVAEVNQKMENLAVDNTNEANETKPRGPNRNRGGRPGRKFSPRPPYEDQVKKIEEELAAKKVLEKGVKGYVKWFSVKGRYGFLARENESDESQDFFVHQTAIIKSRTVKYYLRTLDEEEPVVFDIVEGRKGPEAANVTGPDGENVRGSRYARYYSSRLRRGPPKGDRKPREENTDEKEKSDKPAEESGDGEARTQKKRRVRRARGKLTADGEGAEKSDVPKEKGDGDVAADTDGADGEKKGRRRRNHNNNNNQKGKKEGSGEPTEQKQEAAPAQA